MASRARAKRVVRTSRSGDVKRTTELLQAGADVNKVASDGMTPLMRAAERGHLELVEALLEQGADPNKTAKDGASALFWACVRGHEVIADRLLASGANVNAKRGGDPSSREDGPTVLVAAIGRSSPTLVEKLVRAGAALDERYLGMDMVAYAEWCGRNELVPLLKRRRPRAVGKPK